MNYSVIIPVYNCIWYLRGCVESLPLDREDLEVVLVDDGAADGSGALCDVLAQEYPNVTVIHQSNSGVSAARNRGMQEAKGEYLLFLDSDDTVDHEKLNQLLDVFPETGADMAVFGMYFEYYHRGQLYRQDPMFHACEGAMEKARWSQNFHQMFMDNAFSPVWNKIYKREIIWKYDLKLQESMFLYEDLEFVLRYLAHCDIIWNVQDALYHYRQSEDEGNAARRLQRIDSLRRFMKPLESAMDGLAEIVPEDQRKQVLLQLYLMLARGKIGSSDISGIREICGDYRLWSAGRELPVVDERFQSQLAQGKARALYLQNKKTMLRHKIAVAVKSTALYKQLKNRNG